MASVKITDLPRLETDQVNLSSIIPVVQDGDNFTVSLSSISSGDTSGGGSGPYYDVDTVEVFDAGDVSGIYHRAGPGKVGELYSGYPYYVNEDGSSSLWFWSDYGGGTWVISPAPGSIYSGVSWGQTSSEFGIKGPYDEPFGSQIGVPTTSGVLSADVTLKRDIGPATQDGDFTIRKIFRKLLVPSPGPGDNVLQTFLKEYTPSAYGGAKIAYLEFEYVITKADGGQYWRNGQYYIYPQYDNDIGGAGTNGRSNLWSNTPTNPEIDTSKLNETLDFEFAVDDVAFIVFTGRAIYTDFTEGEDFQVPLAEEDTGDVLVPENNLEDEFTLE